MVSNRLIRERARVTLQTAPGIYYLAVVPVAIALTLNLLAQLSGSAGLIEQLANVQSLTPLAVLRVFAMPLCLHIFYGLISWSIFLTLFRLAHHCKDRARVLDSLTVFEHPRFGLILKTYFLKEVYLCLYGLVLWVGLGLSLYTSVLMQRAGISTMEEVAAMPQDLAGSLVGSAFWGTILVFIGLALFLTQLLALAPVDYLLFQQIGVGYTGSSRRILKASRQLMKGHKRQYFWLNASFVGWYILNSISMGIVGLYFIPYYQNSRLHFFNSAQFEH